MVVLRQDLKKLYLDFIGLIIFGKMYLKLNICLTKVLFQIQRLQSDWAMKNHT